MPLTVLYLIGGRGLEIFDLALPNFTGVLISDSWSVCRSYALRVRCWAHLQSKAKGLSESSKALEHEVGGKLLAVMRQLIDAVGKAGELEEAEPELQRQCERYHASGGQLGEFSRELLNNWDSIMWPLRDPGLPLTNNLVEQMLLHWVIARRISYGTRSRQGIRALALLASIIETCRLRQARGSVFQAGAIYVPATAC